MSTLHPTRTLPALLPRYVERFSCIGAACEDTCCSGWNVDIDKKTFNAYRQTHDPVLKPLLVEKVRRRRSQASDASYARIELEPQTKACPILKDNLCSVQKALGPSYLSNTCFNYPRFTRNFDGQVEQALTLSCPEAARQALLHADAFEFVQSKISVRPESMQAIRPTHGLSVDLMNDIRTFCISLMRTDSLALWQRLAVLGVFCENLQQTLNRSGHAEVPALLQGSAAMVEQGLVLQALEELQPNYPSQAVVFATLWQVKSGAAQSAWQANTLSAVSKGLGAQAENGLVGTEQLVENYRLGITRLPDALMAAPHLLEHYLLNEMFRELFPFGGEDPYDHYLKLISRFGLVRLMLAARCNAQEALPDADALVQTVQTFCRRFQHDSGFAQTVNKVLRNTGMDKLERVYSFLRW
jgi:lysine-N-methylase